MDIQKRSLYSTFLNRTMEFMIYGSSGKPVLFIPCQSGRFYDFENFHMLDHWAQWIEDGKCMVFSVDTIDDEAWGAVNTDGRTRMLMHEKWYHHIVDEMVPLIQSFSGRTDILPFGISMGAMHAANFYFRRPDLFDGVFAISGLYDSVEMLGDYMDDLVYDNCPVYYLANMPQDHPYMTAYTHHPMLIVVGQGDWEGPLLASTRRLDRVCTEKQIPVRFEYWGLDVCHDWPWWYKMVACYMPDFLSERRLKN